VLHLLCSLKNLRFQIEKPIRALIDFEEKRQNVGTHRIYRVVIHILMSKRGADRDL